MKPAKELKMRAAKGNGEGVGEGRGGRQGGTETSGASVSLAELLRLSRSRRPRLPGGRSDLGAPRGSFKSKRPAGQVEVRGDDDRGRRRWED